MPAGTVFLVMVGVLGLAALLNAEKMLHRAETSELGTRRDVALGFWRPVSSVSSSLGLGLPRAGVEAVRELGDGGGQGVDVVASGRPRCSSGAAYPWPRRVSRNSRRPRRCRNPLWVI